MPMNPELKAKWLEALRSGRYQQTNSVLNKVAEATIHQPIGMCCLGVLCDISKAGEWGPTDDKGCRPYCLDGAIPTKPAWTRQPDTVEYTSLPCELVKRLDIYDDERDSMVKSLATAMGMNDNGDSFAVIADFLEQEQF